MKVEIRFVYVVFVCLFVFVYLFIACLFVCFPPWQCVFLRAHTIVRTSKFTVSLSHSLTRDNIRTRASAITMTRKKMKIFSLRDIFWTIDANM